LPLEGVAALVALAKHIADEWPSNFDSVFYNDRKS